MEKSQQELMMKFQMFEQQIEHLNQQMEAVEQGIMEMNSLGISLDEIKGKKGKEILAPIGRGIFVNAKLESEELLVDVGEKTFVKKSVEETKEIIESQVKKLEEVKEELTNELKKIDKELTETMINVREDACSCGHDGNCSCEDGHCNCKD